MTKILLALSLVLALGGGFLLWDNARVRAENRDLNGLILVLQKQREVAENTVRILDERAAKEAERREQVEGVLETLLTREFENADQPIDPDIMRLLNCLRQGNNQVDCN